MVTAKVAALLDSFRPVIEIELAVEVDVAAAHADAVIVYAREICLTADPATVAAIQGVVPDVQFPDRRRIHGADEITSIVGDVNQVFVGADAVHPRHDVIGKLVGRWVVGLLRR